MTTTLFRVMNIADLDAVYEIEKASFQTPWTKASFEQEIVENLMAIYFVLEDLSGILAYGGMWQILDELHITNIAVKPSARGKGHGKTLVQGMIDYGIKNGYKHMTLEVRVGNQSAIKLYEVMGFVSAGIRPKYYVDTGEDALVMWKEL